MLKSLWSVIITNSHLRMGPMLMSICPHVIESRPAPTNHSPMLVALDHISLKMSHGLPFTFRIDRSFGIETTQKSPLQIWGSLSHQGLKRGILRPFGMIDPSQRSHPSGAASLQIDTIVPTGNFASDGKLAGSPFSPMSPLSPLSPLRPRKTLGLASISASILSLIISFIASVETAIPAVAIETMAAVITELTTATIISLFMTSWFALSANSFRHGHSPIPRISTKPGVSPKNPSSPEPYVQRGLPTRDLRLFTRLH